jgi:hypothetical protein
MKEYIFIYWDQGWENAHYIPKIVLKSWIKYNDNDFIIVKLDSSNLNVWIKDRKILSIINKIKINKSITASSDLIRINLMALHGGFWVDATMLCTTPITEYYSNLQNKYNMYFPCDVKIENSTTQYLHNYNYIYCKSNNDIMNKLSLSMNVHFDNMDVQTMRQMHYCYLGFFMYEELSKYIDWNYMMSYYKLSISSCYYRTGIKIIANSKNFLLQNATEKLKQDVLKEKILKLTTGDGVDKITKFPKNSIIQYLIDIHELD